MDGKTRFFLSILVLGVLSSAPVFAQTAPIELADAMDQGLVELTITYAGNPYILNMGFRNLSARELLVVVPYGYIAAVKTVTASRFLFLQRIAYPVAAGSAATYGMPVAEMEPYAGRPRPGTEYSTLEVDERVLEFLRAAKLQLAKDWNVSSTIDPAWECECLRAMLWSDPFLRSSAHDIDGNLLIRQMEADQDKVVSLALVATWWMTFRMSQAMKP